MRTLSTSSKLLAFVAAALGVAASLNLAWFAASPAAEAKGGRATLEGPVEEFFGGIWRALSVADGVSANDRFAGADTALLVLAGLAVLGAALASLQVGERLGRWAMQMSALAIFVLIVVKIVQVSATNELLETRQGAIVALACSGVMFVTAAHIAQQKLRRTPPPPMSALHDPTLVRPGSYAPPGP